MLRRNPHYFDPARAHLDAIVMLENIPSDTQFQMFERGELDTVDKLAAPDYLFVVTEPAWRPYVQTAVGMNAFGSRMNVQVKPFDDRRVRQALNYALDKGHTARLLNGTTRCRRTASCRRGMLGRDPDARAVPARRRAGARPARRGRLPPRVRRRVRDDQRRGDREGRRARCRPISPRSASGSGSR